MANRHRESHGRKISLDSKQGFDVRKGRSVHNQSISDALQAPSLAHKIQTEKSILILATSEDRIFAGTQEGDVLVWSLDSYSQLNQVKAHRGATLDLLLSENDELLFSAGGDAIVNVGSLFSQLEACLTFIDLERS